MAMPREQARNVVEWAAFGLGTALTLGVGVFLLVEAFQHPSEVRLETFTRDAVSTPAGVQLVAGVRNLGGTAAVDVEMEVCGPDGECRTLAFPEVPSEGTREGVAVFAASAGAFTARLLSYRPMNGG